MTKHNAPQEMNHEDFVVWFLEENKRLIYRHARRRLIPNRYSVSDIESYIAERILDILKKRVAKGKPIEDPRLYFKKLIDFYCIEYQRMHGYIYSMPKRPRCPEAEKEISKYGFIYLESGDNCSAENAPQLGYLDGALGDDDMKLHYSYQVKGGEPAELSETWEKLMCMALPEDREVLSCIFTRNMSVPEVSRHLGIAISTAYTRKERGIRAISGTLSSYIDLDKENWAILDNVEKLEDNDISISQFFNKIDD
jgi:hypothetical protein